MQFNKNCNILWVLVSSIFFEQRYNTWAHATHVYDNGQWLQGNRADEISKLDFKLSIYNDSKQTRIEMPDSNNIAVIILLGTPYL